MSVTSFQLESVYKVLSVSLEVLNSTINIGIVNKIGYSTLRNRYSLISIASNKYYLREH